MSSKEMLEEVTETFNEEADKAEKAISRENTIIKGNCIQGMQHINRTEFLRGQAKGICDMRTDPELVGGKGEVQLGPCNRVTQKMKKEVSDLKHQFKKQCRVRGK